MLIRRMPTSVILLALLLALLALPGVAVAQQTRPTPTPVKGKAPSATITPEPARPRATPSVVEVGSVTIMTCLPADSFPSQAQAKDALLTQAAEILVYELLEESFTLRGGVDAEQYAETFSFATQGKLEIAGAPSFTLEAGGGDLCVTISAFADTSTDQDSIIDVEPAAPESYSEADAEISGAPPGREIVVKEDADVQDDVITPNRYGLMVEIPAGYFMMGCKTGDGTCDTDEEPLHDVFLDAFAIDAFEVTNARYEACVQAGKCTPPHDASSFSRKRYYGNPTYSDYPVVNVDWRQAEAFCAWEGKRLPTEAEWERAASGDDFRVFPWGDSAPSCSRLNFYAGYDPKSTWDARRSCVGDTSAVGSYPRGVSPYGLMDMSGNVWEWVADVYQEDYYWESPLDNPSGPRSGSSHVLRGGSWGTGPYVRASTRGHFKTASWQMDIGFRCATSY